MSHPNPPPSAPNGRIALAHIAIDRLAWIGVVGALWLSILVGGALVLLDRTVPSSVIGTGAAALGACIARARRWEGVHHD
jgi:hypothetical protein